MLLNEFTDTGLQESALGGRTNSALVLYYLRVWAHFMQESRLTTKGFNQHTQVCAVAMAKWLVKNKA